MKLAIDLLRKCSGGSRPRTKSPRRPEHRPLAGEALEQRLLLSADLSWAFGQAPMEFTHNPAREFQLVASSALGADAFGNLFHADPFVAEPLASALASGSAADPGVWQGLDLAETFLLHSNPGADHVIYLDFDGHLTSGTVWNTGFNNGNDIVTPAWSSDSDFFTFTEAEKATVQRIWARVSEDFAPFDVDVTTEEPAPDDLLKASAGDTRWGIRAVIGPNTWFSPAGGVAYHGSFNWDSDTPCFVFNTGEVGVAETASHEIGHTLGVLHDGDSTSDYYPGHGSGATSWAPIMGVAYNKSVTQWSRGEYSGANNQQDDLAIITSQNGFGYRQDDHQNDPAAATELTAPAGSEIAAAYGIIEQNTDVDVFSFWAAAGTLALTISPLSVGANLDILAQVYDWTNTLIAQSNLLDSLAAELSVPLAAAGEYFLSVSGTGRGDPLVDGYSDYGSLGHYRITGVLPAWETSGTAPEANEDQAETTVGSAVTIDVLTNDVAAAGTALTVTVVTQGEHGFVSINPDGTVLYSPTVAFACQDVFTYTVSDSHGGQATAAVYVRVAEPQPLANGGFEQGLSGWERLGDATTQTAQLGEVPLDGQYQAVITNANAAGGNVLVAGLEAFLGLASGALNAVTIGSATAGSAIRRPVTVAAGAELTIAFNFLTYESTPNNTYNDFSFFTVSGPGTQAAILLADTHYATFRPSPSAFSEATGYAAISYTFAQAGQYTIGFGVADAQDTSFDSALLVDSVALHGPTGSPPAAVDDHAEVAEDTSLIISVLANDSDPDGDPVSLVQVTQAVSGTVAIRPDGTVEYTPHLDFHGSDSFTYTIDDGQGGHATGTVFVTVLPVNDAPIAADDAASTNAGSAVTCTVLGNDFDVDGDLLEIVSVTQPASGTVVINHDRTLTFTPHAGFVGMDEFSYTISDGMGGAATAGVTVVVTGSSRLDNGGFEDGLAGWEVRGDAKALTGSYGEAPAGGVYQAVLTNANGAGGNVTLANLESFLGQGGGTLESVAVGRGTAGSAIRQTITVSESVALIFQYSFLTKESTPDSRYNDFSFFTVSGAGIAAAYRLADTYTAGFRVSSAPYRVATEWAAYTFVFPQAGDYVIGFGMADSQDTSYDSALRIDEVRLVPTTAQALPEEAPPHADIARGVVPAIASSGHASEQATGPRGSDHTRALALSESADHKKLPETERVGPQWQERDGGEDDERPAQGWSSLVDDFFARFELRK